MITEQWKQIKNYEGMYEVSNLGNVRSVDRILIKSNNHQYKLKGYQLHQFRNPKTYLVVRLSKQSKTKTYNVHRLVAETFIPNTDNKPCVNHIDNNRNNNTVYNLEWVTYKENIQYYYKSLSKQDRQIIYNKIFTVESRKKMSEAKKRYWSNDDNREKQSELRRESWKQRKINKEVFLLKLSVPSISS